MCITSFQIKLWAVEEHLTLRLQVWRMPRATARDRESEPDGSVLGMNMLMFLPEGLFVIKLLKSSCFGKTVWTRSTGELMW